MQEPQSSAEPLAVIAPAEAAGAEDSLQFRWQLASPERGGTTGIAYWHAAYKKSWDAEEWSDNVDRQQIDLTLNTSRLLRGKYWWYAWWRPSGGKLVKTEWRTFVVGPRLEVKRQSAPFGVRRFDLISAFDEPVELRVTRGSAVLDQRTVRLEPKAFYLGQLHKRESVIADCRYSGPLKVQFLDQAGALLERRDIRLPNCRWRFRAWVYDREVTKSQNVGFGFEDYWGRREPYRLCIRRRGGSPKCRTKVTGGKGKSVHVMDAPRLGRYTVTWRAAGAVRGKGSFRVIPQRRRRSPVGPPTSGPWHYTGSGPLGGAIGATKKIARALYFNDPDATGYGARCHDGKKRFACEAIVKGVIRSRLSGRGSRYTCFYGVKVRVRGGTAYAERDGSVWSGNESAPCQL